ncbi:unnamed protein product [Mytilus edulis]|uniref:Uncharacterized protein n=1 Tax=Mytilus edulis TaxID=6550 RepID=A0A8S3UVS6_MYTED|nr:unnamed protein product [Mytilus edulis]
MDLKDSISIEDLSAVAEEGQSTNIDNEYSFSRNKPLAMSTVARGNGAFDQSNQLLKPREVTGSKSEQLLSRQDDSLLSQNDWGQPPYGIGSGGYEASRNSSLGLIQVDAMSDLTGSEFNLYMPGMDQTKTGNRSVQGSSSTENKTGTTLQSSSQGNSLGNSQHISDNQPAFFRHDVDTVKKKPSDKPAPVPEGPVRQSLVFQEMFSNQHDGDVTVPEVNIDEELMQLDDDFSDFDDTGIEDVDCDKKGR